MTKRSISQDDSNRTYNPGSLPQKFTSMASPGASARDDRVPGSQVIPAEINISEKVMVKLLLWILLGGVILVGIWYLSAGQGRRTLESELLGLITSEAPIPSLIPETLSPIGESTPTASIMPPVTITDQPTVTQPSVTTPLPTHTPLINRASVTPTIYVEIIETAEPACREALTITLEDVGKELCVQGTVSNIINKTNNTMVIFSGNQVTLYWVTYDLEWTEGEIGKCYQTTGTINQILNSPVLVFNYNNLPMECP